MVPWLSVATYDVLSQPGVLADLPRVVHSRSPGIDRVRARVRRLPARAGRNLGRTPDHQRPARPSRRDQRWYRRPRSRGPARGHRAWQDFTW